jgi:hypothetical protein
MDSLEILASFVLGMLEGSALLDMAQAALAEGEDSHSLRILAGLSKSGDQWPE